MKDQYDAHSLSGKPPENWHRLEDHLKNVAEIARTFANDFTRATGPIWRGCGMIWGECSLSMTWKIVNK
jgi:hypothetical protein